MFHKQGIRRLGAGEVSMPSGRTLSTDSRVRLRMLFFCMFTFLTFFVVVAFFKALAYPQPGSSHLYCACMCLWSVPRRMSCQERKR